MQNSGLPTSKLIEIFINRFSVDLKSDMAKEKKDKKPKKKRLRWILLGILGVLILYIAFSIISAKLAPIATLIINQGTAEVKYASSNEWITAKSGMAVKEGMTIRTLADSKAVMILRDSSVTRLDENTEININNLDESSVSIVQAAGQTWTRLLKLSGIDDYEIETPDAIATVRGTAFAVSIVNGTKIGVLEGTVHASSYKIESNVRKIIASLDVSENNSLDVNPEKLDKLEAIMLLRDKWINDNAVQDEEHIINLRDKLINRYSLLINIIKSQNNFTDEQIREFVTEFIKGKRSIKKMVEEGNVPKALLVLIPEELKRY